MKKLFLCLLLSALNAYASQAQGDLESPLTREEGMAITIDVIKQLADKGNAVAQDWLQHEEFLTLLPIAPKRDQHRQGVITGLFMMHSTTHREEISELQNDHSEAAHQRKAQW